MIYTRFGCECTITGYYGKVCPKWAKRPFVLVRVKLAEDGSERPYFLPGLKADDAWPEIDAAVDAAPDISGTVTPEELAKLAEEAS